MKKHVASTLAFALAAAAPGCASIMHGTHQRVLVESDSPNAAVSVDGSLVGPGSVNMKRGEDHTVVAEEPGRAPVTSEVHHHLSWGYAAIDSLIAVFTFPIGLVAPIVDLVDGAMWNLEPDHVRLPAAPPEHRGAAY